MQSSPVLRVCVIVLAVRLIGGAVGYAANLAYAPQQPEQFTVLDRCDPFWDSFARYDSGWYYTVAHDGYRYVANERNNLAYFPVYPLLMRTGGRLLGGARWNYFQAGIAISWIAAFAGMVLLYRLARLDVDEDSAVRATLYASVFPFAFFFGRVYTESIFLMFAVASFYAFRTNRWFTGAVAGALATATRPNGILLLPALACIAWQQTSTDRPQRLKAMAAACGVGAGLLIYCVYVYWISGRPLEWAHSIERWNYHPGGAPWDPIIALTRQLVRRPQAFLREPNGLYDTLNGVTAIVVAASIPFVWRKFGIAYALFMALNLALPLSSGEFEGLGRYCSVLFPFFILMGTWRPAPVQQAILMTSVALNVVCLSLFVTLHPIF